MKQILSRMCVATSLFAIAACSNNSSSSSHGPSDNGSYDTKGSDYVALAPNQSVTAHFRGVAKTYDVNGNLTELDSIDQDRTALVMASAVVVGIPGFSLGAYDDNGRLTRDGNPVGYVAQANGVLYASDHDATDKAIVLPNDLSAGSWNPDPHGDPSYQASLTGHMASYTTYNGNTYSNVIKVTASAHDSSTYSSYQGPEINIVNVTADFYFAKGIGPVEVDLGQVEEHHYTIENGVLNRYEKTIYSGSVARNQQ